jgi:D-3-phosphoglycerate dehydrogenase
MRILIADDVHDLLIKGLEEIGHTVIYAPHITRDELKLQIALADGLVIRTKTTIDADVLSHAGQLKFIGRAGAGLDNIDEHYCHIHNIQVFNAGEANADAVGEQAIGMLLALMANIVKADKEVRQRIWDRAGNTGVELSGKTVGIIGYGNTGAAVARKLAGFDVTVLAYDKYKTGFSKGHVQEVSLCELQQQSDIVSLHVPLTDETTHLLNADFIRAMEKPFYLLNLSRGGVVNTLDVANALETGKILGAALDVLENENPASFSQNDELWFKTIIERKNVVLTPHVGGWTRESYVKIAKVLLRKIKELTNS